MTNEEKAFINMINSDSVNGHYAQPVAAAYYEQSLNERAGFVKLVGEMKVALSEERLALKKERAICKKLRVELKKERK